MILDLLKLFKNTTESSCIVCSSPRYPKVTVFHSSILKTRKLTLENTIHYRPFQISPFFTWQWFFCSRFQSQILYCIQYCFTLHISLELNLNLHPYVSGLFVCVCELFTSFPKCTMRTLILCPSILSSLYIMNSIFCVEYVASIFLVFQLFIDF